MCIFVNSLPLSNDELHKHVHLLTLQQRRNLNLLAADHVRKSPQFKLVNENQKSRS